LNELASTTYHFATQTQTRLINWGTACSPGRQRALQAEAEAVLGMDRRLSPELSRPVDASDVVQEAHMVMFSRLDDYLARTPMRFGTWALRTVLDCLGEARRRPKATRPCSEPIAPRSEVIRIVLITSPLRQFSP
jgi:DNA-directed RNA polymerase specialized sigma24 family protein